METFTPSLALCEGTPQKDQWRGALMFSVICAWTNGWRKQSRRRWFETMLPHCFQEFRQSVALSKLCSRPWQAGWFETPSRSLWSHCSMWFGNGQLTPALHHYFIGTGTMVGLHGHRWSKKVNISYVFLGYIDSIAMERAQQNSVHIYGMHCTKTTRLSNRNPIPHDEIWCWNPCQVTLSWIFIFCFYPIILFPVLISTPYPNTSASIPLTSLGQGNWIIYHPSTSDPSR